MQAEAASPELWQRLGELIATRAGLHYPPERQADLQRGVKSAAAQLGFADVTEYVQWLLAAQPTRAELHALVGHLTIGETYFFRDAALLAAVAQQAIPEMLQRHGRDRHLRVWSAACCTGEEAYTLAILLRQHVPDWRNWRITLLATDINDEYLRKARAGVYGDWSFRNTVPGFRERYFTPTDDGRFLLRSELREMVRFEALNLAEGSFPAAIGDLREMDLILCRNVLMYFTRAQARAVIGRLHRALREGGWLGVSPSEGGQALFSAFETVQAEGGYLYRKSALRARRVEPKPGSDALPRARPLPAVKPAPAPQAPAAGPAATSAPAGAIDDQQPAIGSFAEQARALADAGRLTDALGCCQRWIALEKLNPAPRYLLATIQQECGDAAAARQSLQQAIYLQPKFILAHFALGNLTRVAGESPAARRHYRNALQLLQEHAAEEVLPEADGLTAGRVREIIESLLTEKTAA